MKSVFLISPGRCGTHWLGFFLRETMGLEKQRSYPGSRFDYSYFDSHKYVMEVFKSEQSPSSKIYIKHFPIHVLKILENFLDIIVIIRDPRDIIVSASYYQANRNIEKFKECQNNFGYRVNRKKVSFEEYLNSYLDDIFHKDWFNSYIINKDKISHNIVRYEDLLISTTETLFDLFSKLGVGVLKSYIKDMVRSYCFENFANGRHPGEEDVSHHFRKGIIGDWKNYLTPKQNEKFCRKYRYIMEPLGYA